MTKGLYIGFCKGVRLNVKTSITNVALSGTTSFGQLTTSRLGFGTSKVKMQCYVLFSNNKYYINVITEQCIDVGFALSSDTFPTSTCFLSVGIGLNIVAGRLTYTTNSWGLLLTTSSFV